MYWRHKMPPVPAKLFPITPTPRGKRTESTAKGKRKTASWQDIFFIHSIPGQDDEEGLLVLADGSMRKIIACKPPNVLLADEEDREKMAKEFASLANSLKCDIQILVSSRNLRVEEFLSRYQREVTTNNEYLRWFSDYIDKWFRRVQDVHFVPQREFYVVVSYQPPDCRHLTHAWSAKRSPEQEEEYSLDLDSYCKQIFRQLRRSNLCPSMLTRQQTRNLIYAHLNPSLTDSESDADVIPSRPGTSEAELLARSVLKISEHYLWLDGKLVGTQYMQFIPQETWFGWLVELLTLSCEYTASFYIHRSPQDSEDSSKLENEREFDISLYIKTHADSLEHLNSNMEFIRSVFKKKGAILDRAQTMQLAAWQSTLPVGVDKMETVHRVSSGTVGSFWPFFTAMCGMPDGVPFGFAIASREPVLLNPFYRGAINEARNIFMAGAPGSGKSFAIALLIMRLLPLGIRFVVTNKTVDDRGSYRFITELLGPEFCTHIKIGPGSSLVLNPFDLGPDDGKAGDPSEHKVNTLLSLIELMLVTEESGPLTDGDKERIAELIRMAYSAASVRGSVPTISDLARIAEQTAAAESDKARQGLLQQLVKGLTLCTKFGAFGNFLDGTTNIDEKLLIVFDSCAMNEPRLEQITSFILAEFIRRRGAEALERKLKFAGIIDEAATLMKFKAGASLLSDLSVRARDYDMLLVTITQELNHFFCHVEQADSILLNCHSKILLRQEPGDAQLLKEKLRLTAMEKEAIENFGHDEAKRRDSQCLLIVGDSYGSVRVVPSPMDYWICTTELSKHIPKRLQTIEEVKTKNPTINHTDACRQAVYYLGLQSD